MKSINQKIAELVQALGLSPSGFAQSIGVNNQTIYNIMQEKGRRSKPSYDIMKKIVDVHQVNANWFFQDVEMFDKPPDAPQVEITTVFEVEHMKKIETIDAKELIAEFRRIWKKLRHIENNLL